MVSEPIELFGPKSMAVEKKPVIGMQKEQQEMKHTRKLRRLKYSCEEVYERMDNGLCIFCDELDTPGHHDLKHKEIQIFMVDDDLASDYIKEFHQSQETVTSPEPIVETAKNLDSFIEPLVHDSVSQALDSVPDMLMVHKVEELPQKSASGSGKEIAHQLFDQMPNEYQKDLTMIESSNKEVLSFSHKDDRVWEPGGLPTKMDLWNWKELKPYGESHKVKSNQEFNTFESNKTFSLEDEHDDETNAETNSLLEKERIHSRALCDQVPATQSQDFNVIQQEKLIHDTETIMEMGPVQEPESLGLTDSIFKVDYVPSQFQVPIPSLEPSCRRQKESLAVINDLSCDLGCIIGKTIECICDSEIGKDNSLDEVEFNRVWEPGGVLIEHDKWKGSEKCYELSRVMRLMQGLSSTWWSYGKVAELTQELQQPKTYLKGIKLKDLDRLAACSCVDTKMWHCVKHETQQTDFHVWHRWKNKAEKLPANYALLELMMLGLVSFQPNKGNVVVGLVPKAIVLREVSHCRSNDYGTISHNLLLVRDTSSNGYKEDSWSFIWFILKELCSAGFERNKETMKKKFKGLSKLEKDHELLSPENLDVHALYLFRKRGFIEFSGCHTHLKKLRAALEKLPQEFSEELAKRIVIGQKIAGRLIYGDVNFHLKHKWRSRLLQTLSRLEFCVDNVILFTSPDKLLFTKNRPETRFCTHYNDLEQLSTEFQGSPGLDYFTYLNFIWKQVFNCDCEAGHINYGFFSAGEGCVCDSWFKLPSNSAFQQITGSTPQSNEVQRETNWNDVTQTEAIWGAKFTCLGYVENSLAAFGVYEVYHSPRPPELSRCKEDDESMATESVSAIVGDNEAKAQKFSSLRTRMFTTGEYCDRIFGLSTLVFLIPYSGLITLIM